MGEMKSAWEKALEKAEQLGKPSDEELKQLEHVPRGNKLAASYLQDEKFNLDAELAKYRGSEIGKYVFKGVEEIFLRSISLPHNEQSKLISQKAMSGIRMLKEDKKQLDAVFDLINNLLNYYEQALQQTFAQFKQSFEAKVNETVQALQRQPGANPGSIEAGIQQQFQEEWRRTSSQLDAQYEKTLKEHKQQITQMA